MDSTSIITKLADSIPEGDIFTVPFPATDPPYLTCGDAGSLCRAIMASTADGDFFDKAEGCLLSALIRYVAGHEPEEKRTLGRVYEILLTRTPENLDHIFDALPATDEAGRLYGLFADALSNRGSAVLGLTAHLAAFRMLVSEAREGRG